MPGHVSGDAPFSNPCIKPKNLHYDLHPSMPTCLSVPTLQFTYPSNLTQACVVAAREATALPRGQALRARAVMYLALLAGGVLAALRVLPSPMYLASALADPALPQVRSPHSICSNKVTLVLLGVL